MTSLWRDLDCWDTNSPRPETQLAERTDSGPRAVLVIAVAVALGAALGLGGVVFVYAEGDSYLSDDARACINCHTMNEHYDAWLNSSHAAVAVCNDCHAPHGSLVAKYQSKATNGILHAWAFTTGRFPDEIVITASNRAIAEAACRSCHTALVDTIDSGHGGAEPLACIRCHTAVGHAP